MASIGLKNAVNGESVCGYIIGLDKQHEQFEKIAESAIMYMGE